MIVRHIITWTLVILSWIIVKAPKSRILKKISSKLVDYINKYIPWKKGDDQFIKVYNMLRIFKWIIWFIVLSIIIKTSFDLSSISIIQIYNGSKNCIYFFINFIPVINFLIIYLALLRFSDSRESYNKLSCKGKVKRWIFFFVFVILMGIIFRIITFGSIY